MKTKELNFMNVKEADLLSRDEMRSVMAGCGGDCGQSCASSADCGLCCTCQISGVTGTCVSNGNCS